MSREEAKRRAELYQALADGKTLQYYFSTRDKWEDVEGDEFDVIQKVHGFMRFRGMLRIKPEPKKARLKVALNKTNENKYYLCVHVWQYLHHADVVRCENASI